MNERNFPQLADGSIDFGSGVIGPSAHDIEYFNSISEEVRTQFSDPEVRKLPVFDWLADHFPKRLRKPALGVAAAGGILATASGCIGGGGGANEANTPANPNNSPSPKPEVTTPVVTQAPQETPKPTEVAQFVPKKLSEAEFTVTDFDTAVQSLNTAYTNHPEAENIHPLGSDSVASSEGLKKTAEICRDGDPSNPPKFVLTDRLGACSGMTTILYDVYRQTHYEEFYNAAVSWANYFLTELPESQSKFDDLLRPWINDSSPSLEK